MYMLYVSRLKTFFVCYLPCCRRKRASKENTNKTTHNAAEDSYDQLAERPGPSHEYTTLTADVADSEIDHGHSHRGRLSFGQSPISLPRVHVRDDRVE